MTTQTEETQGREYREVDITEGFIPSGIELRVGDVLLTPSVYAGEKNRQLVVGIRLKKGKGYGQKVVEAIGGDENLEAPYICEYTLFYQVKNTKTISGLRSEHEKTCFDKLRKARERGAI